MGIALDADGVSKSACDDGCQGCFVEEHWKIGGGLAMMNIAHITG
jgi:hypothetical protein